MMRLLEVSILATLLLLPLAASFCPRVGIKRTHLSFTRPHATGKDHFDMDELRQRIADEKNPYRKLFEMDDATHTRPEDVHIILFKPDTEEEGVHTIEYPKGSGTNVILAFESKEECTRFAATLKAQHFFDPSVRLRVCMHYIMHGLCLTLKIASFRPSQSRLLFPSKAARNELAGP